MVGTPIITIVIFVPYLFLRIPATPVAIEAPSAIKPTINENSVLLTLKVKSSDRTYGATGEGQPSDIPKMNDPP